MTQLRTKSVPETGQLWISRQFAIMARVLRVDLADSCIEYELIDADGSPLGDAVHAGLDQSWWLLFRPLQGRVG